MALLTNPRKPQAGLVVHDPIKPSKDAVKTVDETKVAFQPVQVDLRWMPEEALLTHIEGASWVVTYFSQVLTDDSDLSGQQSTASGVYQQFIQIDSMEIRVSSALETSQESDGKSMTVTGSAMTLPFIVPNEGDMFIAEISPGQKALFRITSTTKKSIFNQACYEIAYGLDTTEEIKIALLYTKVVKNLYYHSNYLTYGKNPLLVASQAQALNQISQDFFVLLEFYLRKFISIEYRTLIVPDQTSVVHDPWLTQFVLDSFSTTNSVLLMKIRQINMQGDAYLNTPNIWKAIQERNIAWMKMGFAKFELVSRAQFEIIPALAGYRYSGMAYLVYPNQGMQNVDSTIWDNSKIGSSVWLDKSKEVSTPAYWLQDQTPVEEKVIDVDSGLAHDNQEDYTVETELAWFDFPRENPRTAIPQLNLFHTTKAYERVIAPVSAKDWYVFTAEFYKLKPHTTFEKMVLDHIEKKPVDPAQLSDLSKVCLHWGNIEQFYYVPIILGMMKSALMGG